MAAREVVVVAGVRTGIGDYGGALKDVAPTRLGATAIKEALATGQDRSGERRARRRRQRDPRRGARHVHVARGRDRRRIAGRHALPDRQPPVRQRPAGDRFGRAAHPARRRRRRDRRRRREHEPRGLFPARRALGNPHGRRPAGGRHDRRAARSVRPRPHGRHRGEHRGQIRLHARAAGRVRARIAPARRQRAGEGLFQEPDRAAGAEDAQRRRAVRQRRACAARRQDRGPAEAQSRVQEGRLGYGGQRFRA